MSPIIRPGVHEDASTLAPRLRPQDALELTLSDGPDLASTLARSVAFSTDCWAAEEDGRVIALGGFGVAEGTAIGIPWMVGSPEVTKYPVKLVSVGREAVARWEPLCEVMMNFSHAENRLHHRWLERIGFTLAKDPIPWGHAGAPFIQFYRYSKCANQQP